MNKKVCLLTLLGISAVLATGLFRVNNSYQKTSAIEEEVEGVISGVQVRSTYNTGGHNENYIVIQDETIEATYPAETTSWISQYTAPNKIKIYLSDEDEGTYLADIIANDIPWNINRWSCGGVMFPLSDETFNNTYNGASIYKIEILEGCTYPNNKSQKVINNQHLEFVNLNWGDYEHHKYEAFEWADDSGYERSEEKLTIFRAEVRGNVDSHEYYIDLGCELYLSEPETYFINLGKHINAYSKIIVYTSENDGKPLSEVTSMRSGVVNKWTSQGFMFDLSETNFDLYNGTTIHHIDVLEGCELIYQNKICEVLEPMTFTNSRYGDPTAKYECIQLLPPFAPVPPLDEPIGLVGAQVRADVNEPSFYIDLVSEAYIGLGEMVYPNIESLNCFDHVKIYLSENGSPINLGDVTSLRSAYQNKWTNPNYFMFDLTESDFETYNGTTIYMIEVLKDCELYVDGALALVDRTYRFVNSDYGKPEAKYEAFNFYPKGNDFVNFGPISMMNIHNRMDSNRRGEPDCQRWIMFLFEQNIYSQNMVVTSWIDKLNFLDNVYIYSSENAEPYTLRTIFQADSSGVTIMQFGERNMLGVSISNEQNADGYLYDCAHMYSIVIEAGTQIPSFENGDIGYRIVEEKTMIINDEYGLTGPIPNSIDDQGHFRLYEEWNLNWSVVRCLVSFRVVGIEGLSFRDISLQNGQRVSLDEYKQEGYDLSAETEEGDKIYQYIIGVNRNLKVVLTYTPAGQPDNPSGNKFNPVIPIAIVGGCLLVGGAVVLIIFLKKRKGIKNEK